MSIQQASQEDLFLEYHKTKDVTIRNRILEKYLFIAQIVAKKYTGRGVDYDDLYQVASLALLKVIDRFEYDRGIKFESFAMPSLLGEVKNYFRDKTRVMRIPRRDSEQLIKLSEAKAALSQDLGYSPRPDQLADYMNLSLERVLELLETQNANNVVPLDKLLSPDDDTDISTFVGLEDASFQKIENKDFLKYCFSELDEKEKRLIIERFYKNKTQKQVATLFNVSQMYISRMEKKIFKKLREIYQR